MILQIIGPDGKPLPDYKLQVKSSDIRLRSLEELSLQTDAQGRVAIDIAGGVLFWVEVIPPHGGPPVSTKELFGEEFSAPEDARSKQLTIRLTEA